MMDAYPSSCDTFVVLPPKTVNGGVIFGKNSDRPASEVQEVVFVPASDHQADDKTQCTYISVPEVSHTYSVVLSKPAWMWGAEMGSNEHGVCIGNEAVFTKAQDKVSDAKEKLLGMDIVRLGLERSKTAKEALDVMTTLLQQYGQGGCCYEDMDKHTFTYHNSFIIADSEEAWVLETAGIQWAAEQITSGCRNISNELTIGSKIDAMSTDLKNFAKEKGWWDGVEEFDFAKVYKREMKELNDGKFTPSNRFSCGKTLLEKLSENDDFDVMSMLSVLRDQDSGICRVGEGKTKSVSTGSQVSLIYPKDKKLSCHWFTATPNPDCSVFKPFIFVSGVRGSDKTISPVFGDQDPVKCQPRFQRKVDREHALYRAHKAMNPIPGTNVNQDVHSQLMLIEKYSIADVLEYIENYQPSQSEELQELFKDSVDTEIKFYKNI